MASADNTGKARFNLFFRQPRLTILTILLICVAGLGAFNSLPRQEDPDLTRRWASVRVDLPGADAFRVESLVTEKIEKKLQEIPEIKRISSRSQTGVSIVSIQLEDNITAVDEIWAEVRSELTDVRGELPEQAAEPDFEINTTAAFTLLLGFKWTLDDHPQLDLMSRLVQELEDSLSAMAGTQETELYGEPVEEILVSVDTASLAAANLTIRELSNRIATADPKISAGRLQGSETSIVLEVGGVLDTVERVRQIPLSQGEDGFLLRVADVATVDRTTRDPPAAITLIDGEHGIILAAKMEANRRVDRWTAAAFKRIERFEETLPPGIEMEVLFQQGIHTQERLVSLANNLLLGAGLVVLVLFVMMGWRSALIVATSLPLALMMVLTLFNVVGIPLHQISITGLIIALGLLIDNGIVAVDEYKHFRHRGLKPGPAIDATVRYLFIPLMASTLTTILTFLPLAIAPGNAGEFVSALGVGVILSILCSLFLSLTVVPSIAGWIDSRWPGLGERGGFLANGLSTPRLAKVYRGALRITLRWPVLGIMLGLALPISGFALSTTLVNQFFPPVNRNQFQVQMKLPPQSSIEETRRFVETAREVLHSHPEVVRSHWFIGRKPPRVYYNITISEDRSARFAAAFVDTVSPDATFALLPKLQKEMTDLFPEATVLTLPFEQGPPIESPIELRVYGPDVSTLNRLGEELRLILSQTVKVTYAEASITSGQPKLLVRPDEDAARLAGFTLTDLASQLDGALDGVTGGTILEGTEEIPVRVRIAPEERKSLSRIAASTLATNRQASDSGADTVPIVPLNAIAKIDLVPSVGTITRRHGERVNTVRAFLEPFTLSGIALKDFRGRLAESDFQLPAGYRIEYGGESEGSGEARANLLSVFAPLMVLMISTLVLAFNSFRMAMIIASVAVLSVGCGLAAVWSLSYPLGFMAVIGIMGLIGIAINDSIVVLAALRADEKARYGDLDASVEVVMLGSRHILSTTFTTIGGFIPLIVWGGIFWPPLAVAVAGGMIGATILALFYVPPCYRLFGKRRKKEQSDPTPGNDAAAAVPVGAGE